jgi:hypothetical protein
MLNFDLLDTVAGQQIFEEGVLKDARKMVLEALTERFVAVPDDIRDTVHSLGRHEVLKEHEFLFRTQMITSGGRANLLKRKCLLPIRLSAAEVSVV